MTSSNTDKNKMRLEVISPGNPPRSLEVNPAVWQHRFSPHLLSLYNRYSLFNRRRSISKTKNRAEVSGGGRKPWRQKGTGRARQGSIRSPQWRGGGVVFGPTSNENYSIQLNKKVRKQALSSLLSRKLAEGELMLVDKLSMLGYETRNAILFLRNLQLENKKTLLVLSSPEEMTEYTRKSFANLVDTSITSSSQVSISKLLSSRFVVFTEKAFREMEEKLVA